ncbi:hypothetical protein F2Q69_00024240 [Brassica cretica]|uniref:Uncharacterized protein n=1 Tax=Brassica cretica TaxID=69181 RepID=A0A8S9QJE8_BRACR|nr:hypothetical protein F2Q69_00024240 [Brassica cretica]
MRCCPHGGDWSELAEGLMEKPPCRDVVDMLQWACVWSLVVPLIPLTWKWIIRKNYHDEMLPPWWGLVEVGRRFDGEARSVCIKGDASAHTPDAYAARVAILGLSSGRTSVCVSGGSLVP